MDRPAWSPSPVGLFLLMIAGIALSLAESTLAAADPAVPAVIRFGISSIGVGGTQFVGGTVVGPVQAKGLLEQEFKADGIRIDWLFHKGAGPAVNEGIAAGNIDIAWQGDLPMLIGRASGLPTRLIMAAGRGGNTYLAVPANSPAKTLRDLVGKRVVLFRGTASQLVVDRILAAQGLSERDFQIITLNSADAITALTNGDVDGAWGTNLYFELRDRGLIRFVFSTQDPPPVVDRPWANSETGLIVTTDFATKYPQIVQRIVNVFAKEAVWASDPAHAEELFAIWSKSGTPAAHFREDFTGTTPARRLSPLLDAEFLGELAIGLQQAQDRHLVRNPVDLDAWTDHSFLDHALASLPPPLPWTARPAAQH